jgi:hypothetical protein
VTIVLLIPVEEVTSAMTSKQSCPKTTGNHRLNNFNNVF